MPSVVCARGFAGAGFDSRRSQRKGAGILFASVRIRSFVRQRRSERNRVMDHAHAHHHHPTPSPAAPAKAPAGAEYTCPMHPQIVRAEPGSCPICGMALELRTVTAQDTENAELASMTKRFWISTLLTLPVFGIAMAEMIPGQPVQHALGPRDHERREAGEQDREVPEPKHRDDRRGEAQCPGHVGQVMRRPTGASAGCGHGPRSPRSAGPAGSPDRAAAAPAPRPPRAPGRAPARTPAAGRPASPPRRCDG